MVVYETRAIKYQKEASKAEVRLEEIMGEFDESDNEDEPKRKRPRTMGSKKPLRNKRKKKLPFSNLPLSLPCSHKR